MLLAVSLVFVTIFAFRVYRSSRASPADGLAPDTSRPTPKLNAGARVVVSADYHWAQNTAGTVTRPPYGVRNLTGDWQGVYRYVRAVKGPLLFYWVQFDTPQPDTEGDGPYFGGEIESEFLQPGPGAQTRPSFLKP